MKLIRSVHPVTEEHRQQLERELEIQKERLFSNARRAADALRSDLSVANWARSYPIEAAILIVLGGFVVAQAAQRGPRIRGRLVGETRAA